MHFPPVFTAEVTLVTLRYNVFVDFFRDVSHETIGFETTLGLLIKQSAILRNKNAGGHLVTEEGLLILKSAIWVKKRCRRQRGHRRRASKFKKYICL